MNQPTPAEIFELAIARQRAWEAWDGKNDELYAFYRDADDALTVACKKITGTYTEQTEEVEVLF